MVLGLLMQCGDILNLLNLLLHKSLVLSSTIFPFNLTFVLVKVESKLLALQMASLSLVNWAVQTF